MLDEFGAQIENAESKLDATMRKMVSFFLSIGFYWALMPSNIVYNCLCHYLQYCAHHPSKTWL